MGQQTFFEIGEPVKSLKLSKKKGQCFYCDRPAKFLCDFEHDSATNTCDRPICEDHRRQVGNIFFCGRKPDAGVESVDWCTLHDHHIFPADEAKKLARKQPLKIH